MAKQIQANDFLGKGWSFPPAFSLETNGVLMTEKEEDIQRSLKILLTTTVGERLMEPKFGCNLEELIFEPLDTGTQTIIKDKVKTAILYFEPRIDADKIELNTTNILEGEVLLEIEYTVRSTNSRFNFVFPFYRNEGTELNILTTNQSTAL